MVLQERAFKIREESKAKVIKLVENKGGKILNVDNYINNSTKLDCICEFGHKWQISSSNLKNGKWCNICSKNKKLDIEYCYKLAEERAGECLSTEYKNSQTKMRWRCKYGHEFDMKINAINSRGSWCPYCQSWSAEEICRLHFEQIFDCKFPKIRPNWLISPYSNKSLELDGYCHNKINGFNIAFEHQGVQHYEVCTFADTDKLEQIQNKDKLKLDICAQRDIILIQIPHLFRKTLIADLPILIKNSLSKFMDVSEFNFEQKINYQFLYSNNIYYDQIKEIVEINGGKLISTEYFNVTEKMEIECENKHLFRASANSLKNGSWCKQCAMDTLHNEGKLTIDEMRNLAKERNGDCLSVEYIGYTNKLLWLCHLCDKSWLASPRQIKGRGAWCPNCNINNYRKEK